jgi:uncharacterized protein YkwD
MTRIPLHPRTGGRWGRALAPLILSISLGLAPVAAPTDSEVLSFVRQMNDHRVSIGLPPLIWDRRVAAVARAHSRDMVTRHFFSHTNPDGLRSRDRLGDAGIAYVAMGENIAFGQTTGASVLKAWLESSGHRANIENPAYTHHGVGKVGTHWTHVFLRPKATTTASR